MLLTVIDIYCFAFFFFFSPLLFWLVCGLFQRDARKYYLLTLSGIWILQVVGLVLCIYFWLFYSVVEFKMEESMKKAAEVLNKHSLSGRPLKVKEVSSFFFFLPLVLVMEPRVLYILRKQSATELHSQLKSKV